MQIKDGLTGRYARVNANNRLNVNSVTNSTLQQESLENGNAYSFSTGASYAATALDTILAVTNNSDSLLHIDKCVLNNGATAVSEWLIHFTDGTAIVHAGTNVVPLNLNRNSGNVANATATRDETDNTQGNILTGSWLAIDTSRVIDLRGVFLGRGDTIAIDLVTTNIVSATIYAHYVKNSTEV